MKPIDIIKRSIDSDLMKYHSFDIYYIKNDSDVRDIRGVGLCARVFKYEPISGMSSEQAYLKESEEVPQYVTIINRPPGWMESDISSKYFVLTISPSKDCGGVVFGMLVGKTRTIDDNMFNNFTNSESDPVDVNGKSMHCKVREGIIDGNI